MICPRPIKLPHATVGCGKCDACVINKRRVLILRMLLEARDHPAAFFITLTYKDECLPNGQNLSPTDLQLFFKLLRRRYEPAKFRYFAVGEYGSRFGRPHYHFVLYSNIWITERMVSDVWDKGFVDIKLFEEWSASYLAGYIEPGSSARNAPRPDGRVPEFTRQSLKPGIGYGAAAAIAVEMLTRAGLEYIVSEADVPGVLRVNQKLWPLGPYLKRVIKVQAGIDEPSMRRMQTVKKMVTPPMSKEEVLQLEKRRRHSARSASRKVRLAKMKETL